MWYVPKRVIPTSDTEVHENVVSVNRVGRCRRRAPTLDGYPVVLESDWCGDHKIDERRFYG